MTEIYVQLLGTPQITADGASIHFPYRKAEGLFYYLCVKKSISREEAISVLWASADEKAAKKNLRDALYHIRNLFGASALEVANNTMIRLGKQVQTDLDQITPDNIRTRYTGDFLSFFFIKNCLEFEAWTEETRAFYKNMYLKSLQSQFGKLSSREERYDFQAFSTAFIENDLYNEENYRYLMQIYAQKGDYNAAIQLYQNLCKTLKADLNETPAPETVSLYQFVLKLKGLGSSAMASQDYYLERPTYVYKLFAQLSSFQSGSAASVLVCGEIGTGKTQLLHRLHSTLDSQCLILNHTCSRTEKDSCLQTWHHILLQLVQLKQLGQISFLPAQWDMLQDLNLKLSVNQRFSSSGEDAEQPDMMVEAILNTFLYSVRHKKVIFFLDDIHWMDRLSRRLLASILIQMGGQNAMMIATCREESKFELSDFTIPLFEKNLLLEIQLPAFSREEARHIVADLLPSSPQRADELFEQTEGNPLFLVEAIRQIQSQEEDVLSSRVVNVVQSILLELEPDEAELLEVLSIFDGGTGIQELTVCLSKSELELCSILENLVKRRLVDDVTTQLRTCYRFHSPCIGRYLRGQMSSSKQKILHHCMAQYYLQRFQQNGDRADYPKLIKHFFQSDNPSDGCFYKIHYWDELACLYYEDYPRLDGPLSQEMAERAIPLISDYFPKLEQMLNELKSSNTNLLKALLLFTQGRQEIFQGRYREGLACLRTSFEFARIHKDSAVLLRICSQAAQCCIKIANYEQAREYIQEYKKIVNDCACLDEDGHAMYLQGYYHCSEGRYDEAIDALWKALDLYNKCESNKGRYPIDMAATYYVLGCCRYAKREYDLAARYFMQGLRIIKTGCPINGLCELYSSAGQAFYRLGHFAQAEEYFRQGMDLFQQTHTLRGMDKALIFQAMLALRTGNLQQADALFEQSKQLAEQFYEPGILKLLSEFEELKKAYHTK